MTKYKFSKILKISHALSAGLFFFSLIVLGYLHLQFRGYWTPKIIAWFWIINTIVYIVYFWRTTFAKIYTVIFGVLLVLSIIAMAIPFFTFVYYVSTLDDYQRFTLNDEYCIERTTQQALSMPRVYVYHVKYGIFEENPMRPSYEKIVAQVFNKSILDYIPDVKHINLDNVQLVSVDNQGISINYTIQNQSKTIFHPFKNDDGY